MPVDLTPTADYQTVERGVNDYRGIITEQALAVVDEREAFEAWFEPYWNGPQSDLAAWSGWQARAGLSAQPPQPERVLGADRLAAAVARLVSTRTIDARSEAADALLDYLDIGGVGGPADVPTWLRQYEAAHHITKKE